ncbi:hypothetical protein Ahy_A03g011732 [Arachis hypogaea]|uniref:CCHC-type domain-containing protein n=1 Tax=Arachis hypogaea TaxID=3818 RepID=A0A445DRK8_ARAHY|nr:hypothetical protein Ahy_A03g011732 [Arachis hypogaea]
MLLPLMVHTSIDAVIARSNGAWSPPRAWHMYCIRHIGSNFLRRFKAPYLHKLVVNTGISTRCYGSIRTKVLANWTLRRTTNGRPKSTRYLNEMDSREIRGPRRCTICGREGHSRSRCPQLAGPSSAGGH